MRALLARYRVREGQGDHIEHVLQKMAEAVRKDEPACLTYHAARSIEEPHVFVLYEEYEDEAALLAHRETPHFREFVEKTIVPLLESREREVLRPIVAAAGDTP